MVKSKRPSARSKRTKVSTRRADTSMRVPRLLVPDQMHTRLSYGDVWDLAAGPNPYAHNVFRMNSLYDPDYSGAGGTPSGFAQFCGQNAFYTRYQVYACTLAVHFVATHASQVGLCGILFGGDQFPFPATGTLYQQAALEGNTCVSRVINCASNEGATATIRATRRIASVLGLTDSKDDVNTAFYNGNPARSAFADVFIVNADGTTIGITCRVVVRVTYDVVFSNRTTPLVD